MRFCAPGRAGALCLLLLGGALLAPPAEAAERAGVHGRRKQRPPRAKPSRVKRERGKRRHHRDAEPPAPTRGADRDPAPTSVAVTPPAVPPARGAQTFKPPPGPLPKLDLPPAGPGRTEDEPPPFLGRRAEEPAAAPATPLWKRWWLWAIVGGVVATGVGVGVGVGVSRGGSQIPQGIEIRDAF